MKIIKFWFSISKEEQKKRFDARLNNPLKRWKFSPVDVEGHSLHSSVTAGMRDRWQHLQKPSILLTFDVSNVKQKYDCLIRFKTDRTDLEWYSSKKNAD